MQGKAVNGYTLKSPLGSGGMAEVWLAENRIGKKASVKVLLPKFSDDQNVTSRFLTEAKIMVELDHRNIRQVYDYGDIDGRPCIIMEYLDGDDLKSRMKHGQRFTEEELEKWWNQLVNALNYTHAKGIVHRDIKPGNIFVTRDGDIKLLDFGIAKIRESISSTQTGQKIGTLMYMSPEQVKDSKHIDYHTDIYSLAVTFVHLLSRKKPYDSDTSSDFEISEQIVYHPLDLNGIPEKWRLFLEPYLNKDPQARPDLKVFDIPVANPEPKSSFDDEATVCNSASMSQSTPPQTTPLPKDELKDTPTNSQKEKKTPSWIAIVVIVALAAIVTLVFSLSSGSSSEEEPRTKQLAENYLSRMNDEKTPTDESTTNEMSSSSSNETSQKVAIAQNEPVKEKTIAQNEPIKEEAIVQRRPISEESVNLDKPDRNGITARNKIKNGDNNAVKYMKIFDQMCHVLEQKPSAKGFVRMEVLLDQMSKCGNPSEEACRKACAAIGFDYDEMERNERRSDALMAKWETWANDHLDEILDEEERQGLK